MMMMMRKPETFSFLHRYWDQISITKGIDIEWIIKGQRLWGWKSFIVVNQKINKFRPEKKLMFSFKWNEVLRIFCCCCWIVKNNNNKHFKKTIKLAVIQRLISWLVGLFFLSIIEPVWSQTQLTVNLLYCIK